MAKTDYSVCGLACILMLASPNNQVSITTQELSACCVCTTGTRGKTGNGGVTLIAGAPSPGGVSTVQVKLTLEHSSGKYASENSSDFRPQKTVFLPREEEDTPWQNQSLEVVFFLGGVLFLPPLQTETCQKGNPPERGCFLWQTLQLALWIQFQFFDWWLLLLLEMVIEYSCLRIYVPQIHVDLSSRFLEFLPESNRRPRDWQSRALTNWASVYSQP